MDGVTEAIVNVIWGIAVIAICEGIRYIFKQRKEDKNITRLYHEHNTARNIIDYNCRRIESMACDQENKEYGQHN